MAATEQLPGGGTPLGVGGGTPAGQQSVSIVPQATYDTTLTHDVGPVQFAGLLTILGLLWFVIPGRYHWLLTFALLLGALFYANDVADKEGRLQPVSLFQSLVTGKGL